MYIFTGVELAAWRKVEKKGGEWQEDSRGGNNELREGQDSQREEKQEWKHFGGGQDSSESKVSNLFIILLFSYFNFFLNLSLISCQDYFNFHLCKLYFACSRSLWNQGTVYLGEVY